MEKTFDSVAHRGMNASQILELYDDTISLPNLYDLLQKNRELAKTIKDKLNPIQDIAYGNEAIQKLDIYAPKQGNKLPVLIDIHGGGWAAGSKNARSIPAEAIMSQGVMWVPIDYGLAPEYSLETMINHVRTALAWIYRNISQYGGNPNQIFISGQSAGAHLAATALMPDWHKDFDLPPDLIKGLIGISGVYDLRSLLLQSYKIETQEILQLTHEDAKRFSPLCHLPKNSIPIMIAYGNQEPYAYMCEAKDYAKALENVNCRVDLIEVADANHFDMINEIGNYEKILFKAVMKMIFRD